MFALVRFSCLVGLGWGLFAQSVNDLNSLVLQADRFASRQMAPCHAKTLDLFRIIGTSGQGPENLMEKGVDLGQWTLMYQAGGVAGPPPGPPLPIFDCKTLEPVWITLTLDAAIDQLRRQGFSRGFSSLTLMRPLHPRLPDECTFVFKCPPEEAFVGISAQTGKWLWTEPFPR